MQSKIKEILENVSKEENKEIPLTAKQNFIKEMKEVLDIKFAALLTKDIE